MPEPSPISDGIAAPATMADSAVLARPRRPSVARSRACVDLCHRFDHQLRKARRMAMMLGRAVMSGRGLIIIHGLVHQFHCRREPAENTIGMKYCFREHD